ncbi:MAG: DUF6783 domain-containing protein [Ruminococcus sp.]
MKKAFCKMCVTICGRFHSHGWGRPWQAAAAGLVEISAKVGRAGYRRRRFFKQALSMTNYLWQVK